MRLSKFTSHAIRILTDCAQAYPNAVRASEIARRQRITEFNVAKVMAALVEHGFVETIRGRSGGVRLSRPPAEIGVGDVVRATEQTSLEADCFGETVECQIKRATRINRVFDEALRAFSGVLDDYTLADLASVPMRSSESLSGVLAP